MILTPGIPSPELDSVIAPDMNPNSCECIKLKINNVKIIIFEASSKPLFKVKISGGGRCNVTHHCFEPRELIQNYPRGSKELLGGFTRFGPTQTIEWFAKNDIKLVAESDGRMFPEQNTSQAIIDCFYKKIQKYETYLPY